MYQSKLVARRAKQATHHSFIIQFDGPVKQVHKERLSQFLGSPLADYLPHHAYLVHAEIASMEDLQTRQEEFFVRWVGLVPSQAKL